MENSIKLILKMKRDLKAESLFIHKKMEEQRFRLIPELEDRMVEIDNQLESISSWMTLLNEDEAYVIRRHLIDGIDIPRIAIEYKERWGEEYAKSERTLKSYQRKALQKIARFEMKKQELTRKSMTTDK